MKIPAISLISSTVPIISAFSCRIKSTLVENLIQPTNWPSS